MTSDTCASPVGDADGGVHGEESQELLVQHLVDAAFPGQQQLGEATEAGVRHSGRVGDRHWWERSGRSSQQRRTSRDEKKVMQRESEELPMEETTGVQRSRLLLSDSFFQAGSSQRTKSINMQFTAALDYFLIVFPNDSAHLRS